MTLENKQKIKLFSLITLIVFLLIGSYFLAKFIKTKDSETVFCTEETKLCEDGSYVGRTGHECKFSDCPEVKSDEGWKTYKDEENNIEYKLP